MCQVLIVWILALCVVVANASAETDADRAYKRLGSSGSDRIEEDTVRTELDLRLPHVSEFMVNKMNALSAKGRGTPAFDVMRSLLKDRPEIAFTWLLDNYGRFSPAGRANMVGSLGATKYLEAYELVVLLLNDTSDVVSKHARAMSPDPFYTEMRVCDYAYNVLTHWLWEDHELGNDMRVGLFLGSTTEERDEAIGRFRKWWKQESVRILKNKQSLGKDYPTVTNKLGKLMRK